jgi:hypothetical protein
MIEKPTEFEKCVNLDNLPFGAPFEYCRKVYVKTPEVHLANGMVANCFTAGDNPEWELLGPGDVVRSEAKFWVEAIDEHLNTLRDWLASDNPAAIVHADRERTYIKELLGCLRETIG